MNIEYRKIFNKNHVVISDCNIAEYKECYRSKMLKNNKLNNFLVYDTQTINGEIHFTYDISSKQTIYSFYENSDIEYEAVRHLMMSLKSALDALNNYLLEPDYIILDPKMIYMNIATKNIYFCYCPGEKNNFYESLNSLLCYILSKINHDDNNSIILAYSLQQQSTNNNYTFDDLIEILNKPVFQQKKNHINQTEEKKYNTGTDCNRSEYETNTDYNYQQTSDSYDSFSDLSRPLSKKNSNTSKNLYSRGSLLLPACIFFISLGAILYYGMILRLISSQQMILLSAVSAFICLNLFTFIKNRQSKKQTSSAKIFNHKTAKTFTAKDSLQENSSYCDTSCQNVSYSDTLYENMPYSETSCQNMPYSETSCQNMSYSETLHQNLIYQNSSAQENSCQNTLYSDLNVSYQDSDASRKNSLYTNKQNQNAISSDNPHKNKLYFDASNQNSPYSDNSCKVSSYSNIENQNYIYQNNSDQNTKNQNNKNESSAKPKPNYYEDTVILGYRSSENLPRLVYTGTDFSSENELTNFPFIIGKMEENVNMVIDHPMISRIHAKIYLKENHYYIEDMNSSNGTYINNTMIQPHSLAEISTGDHITFSHLTYIFQ